jgi:hypothetical protein
MAQEAMDATLQGPGVPEANDPHSADSPFEFSNS